MNSEADHLITTETLNLEKTFAFKRKIGSPDQTWYWLNQLAHQTGGRGADVLVNKQKLQFERTAEAD